MVREGAKKKRSVENQIPDRAGYARTLSLAFAGIREDVEPRTLPGYASATHPLERLCILRRRSPCASFHPESLCLHGFLGCRGNLELNLIIHYSYYPTVCLSFSLFHSEDAHALDHERHTDGYLGVPARCSFRIEPLVSRGR